MRTKVKVDKEFAVHIPKEVAEELNIREGDTLTMKIKGNKIILEVDNAILLSVKGKKFAKISREDVERISEEEQRKYESTD